MHTQNLCCSTSCSASTQGIRRDGDADIAASVDFIARVSEVCSFTRLDGSG
jgi:hypothetical protein